MAVTDGIVVDLPDFVVDGVGSKASQLRCEFECLTLSACGMTVIACVMTLSGAQHRLSPKSAGIVSRSPATLNTIRDIGDGLMEGWMTYCLVVDESCAFSLVFQSASASRKIF